MDTNMKKLTLGLCSMMMLAGCASAEDKANAKRKAELDLEQSSLIVNGDCGATGKALDAWYDKNKAEADKLDAWWATQSDSKKDSLMEEHKDMRNKTHAATIRSTIECGFVPMNSRRNP
jgi:hypothetical protein